MYVHASKHQIIKCYHSVINVTTDTGFSHQPDPDIANQTAPLPPKTPRIYSIYPHGLRWNPITLVGFICTCTNDNNVLLLGNTTWYQM